MSVIFLSRMEASRRLKGYRSMCNQSKRIGTALKVDLTVRWSIAMQEARASSRRRIWDMWALPHMSIMSNSICCTRKPRIKGSQDMQEVVISSLSLKSNCNTGTGKGFTKVASRRLIPLLSIRKSQPGENSWIVRSHRVPGGLGRVIWSQRPWQTQQTIWMSVASVLLKERALTLLHKAAHYWWVMSTLQIDLQHRHLLCSKKITSRGLSLQNIQTISNRKENTHLLEVAFGTSSDMMQTTSHTLSKYRMIRISLTIRSNNILLKNHTHSLLIVRDKTEISSLVKKPRAILREANQSQNSTQAIQNQGKV